MVLLRVEAQDNNEPVYLDLGEVSLKADYSILEIQDITQRKSENTQAFTLPFSDTNNQFFSHFYDVNASGSFNPNIKTNASVTSDSVEVINGYLQLLSVNTTNQTYEVVVYGVIANIVNQLADLQLNQLDLSEFNHVLTKDNVEDSWNGAITYTDSSTGDEILYPLIDYGFGYTNEYFSLEGDEDKKVTAENLKPAIKVKTLFLKILESVGYTDVQSSFFNSDFFDKQYMTLETVNETVNASEDSFYIGKSTSQSLSVSTPYTIVFDEQIGSQVIAGKEFYDRQGNLDSNGFYTVPADGYYNFEVRTSVQANGSSSIQRRYKVSVQVGTISTTSLGFGYAFGYSVARSTTFKTGLIYVEAGQVIKFIIELENKHASESVYLLQSYAPTNTQTGLRLLEAPTSSANTTIDLAADNNVLPNTPQVEFLKSIVSRYNLVMQPNRYFQNSLDIEPIQDFFDVGSSIDWTDKLDTSKPVTIKPTHEYQKDNIIFEDLSGEDWVNKKFEEKFGYPYNSYHLRTVGDFKQKGNDLKIDSIFSSYATHSIPETGLFLPRIYEDADGEIQRIEAKPKLFYYSGLKSCSQWRFYESQGSTGYSVLASFPFCSTYGMSGQTIREADFDIRFKTREAMGEASFVAETPLEDVFTKFWSEYLNNIFHKDARILTANFKLSSTDIANFKYNDKIFVKDTYYRVNKISNYAIGKDVTTQVELVKILSFNNAIEIGGCDLRATQSSFSRLVSFTDINGNPSSGNKVCCEVNGYTWEYSYSLGTYNCYAHPNARVNTQLPTAQRSRTTQESSLGASGRSTKIKGDVTEFADSENATNGQVAAWNTTDEKVEWVDAPSTNSGGASGDVQYNDGSNGFAGESDFNYDDTTNILSVPSIDASGDISANTFTGDGSNLTNLPATGLNTNVQFNDNGNLSSYNTFTFNKYTGNLNAPRYLGENIGAGLYRDNYGYSAMYLTPADFVPSSSGTYNGFINSNGAKLGWASLSYYSQYCLFQVPKGYKVTSIDLKGSANYTFYIYASSWSSSNATYKAAGTINTTLSLLSYQQLVGNSGDYFIIKFNPTSYGNYIYGCKLLLYPT